MKWLKFVWSTNVIECLINRRLYKFHSKKKKMTIKIFSKFCLTIIKIFLMRQNKDILLNSCQKKTKRKEYRKDIWNFNLMKTKEKKCWRYELTFAMNWCLRAGSLLQLKLTWFMAVAKNVHLVSLVKLGNFFPFSSACVRYSKVKWWCCRVWCPDEVHMHRYHHSPPSK